MDGNAPQPEKPYGKKFSLNWILIVLLIVFLCVPLFINERNAATEISRQEFESKLLSLNYVEKLTVSDGEKVYVYIKKDKLKEPYFKDLVKQKFIKTSQQNPVYWFSIGSVESFENSMRQAEIKYPQITPVEIRYEKNKNIFFNILGWVLPVIFFIFLWRMMLGNTSMMGGGPSIFNFGRSPASIIEKEKSSITFEDVAGLEEAKTEVKEIVDFLKTPEQYMKIGAKIPKGVILIGPTGTGKTLIAKAVAGEANVPFFSISGSAFVEMFVGVGASRVRDLFRNAKEKAPCIIFIDEIDAIGRSRGKGAFMSAVNDERESTLNQLLTEMDGFETNSGVIVLAATNRGDMLDAALLRPGRFDRHIYLELPNLNERESIFKVHMKRLVLEQNINVHELAAQTPGFSGADIANICNEAALISARNKKSSITKLEFLEAIDRIVAGMEKKSKIISQEEKKIIAHHEAGHVLASWLLKRVDPLLKVSIIPRGKSLGAAWYLPEEKNIRGELTFSEHLCSVLAGRAAEEIIFGEVSSGALDDLEKATKEAYTMVAFYGFSKKLGNVSFYDSSGLSENNFTKPYSEETGKLIDEEVRMLISENYERTKKLLTEHRTELISIATDLLKKETLYKEDMEKILGKRNIEVLIPEAIAAH